jgi:hypothetical protein
MLSFPHRVSLWHTGRAVYGYVRKGSRLGGIGEQYIVNPCDMGEDMGHTVKEVKIALPMSHNILTSTEEHIK